MKSGFFLGQFGILRKADMVNGYYLMVNLQIFSLRIGM